MLSIHTTQSPPPPLLVQQTHPPGIIIGATLAEARLGCSKCVFCVCVRAVCLPSLRRSADLCARNIEYVARMTPHIVFCTLSQHHPNAPSVMSCKCLALGLHKYLCVNNQMNPMEKQQQQQPRTQINHIFKCRRAHFCLLPKNPDLTIRNMRFDAPVQHVNLIKQCSLSHIHSHTHTHSCNATRRIVRTR